MSRTRLLLAWLAVTAVTTVIAWQIVAAADDRISEGSSPVIVAVESSTSTSGVPGTKDTAPPSTEGTSPTTTLPDSSTSSSSPISSSSTSTSVPSGPWKIRTLQTAGGSVVVSYLGDQLRLDAVLPSPGFSAEIDDDGPDRVQVEFESDDDDVRIRIERDNEVWDVEID